MRSYIPYRGDDAAMDSGWRGVCQEDEEEMMRSEHVVEAESTEYGGVPYSGEARPECTWACARAHAHACAHEHGSMMDSIGGQTGRGRHRGRAVWWGNIV